MSLLLALMFCACGADRSTSDPAASASTSSQEPGTPEALGVSLGVIDYRDRAVELFVGGGFEVRDTGGAIVARGRTFGELEAFDPTLAARVQHRQGFDAIGYTEQ